MKKVDAVLFDVESGRALTASQVAAFESADRINESLAVAIAAERERCAKVAEGATCGSIARCNSGDCATATFIAERIRSGE